METKNMKNSKEITPFDNCPALDGYHLLSAGKKYVFHAF